jgi:hypothetical protein
MIMSRRFVAKFPSCCRKSLLLVRQSSCTLHDGTQCWPRLPAVKLSAAKLTSRRRPIPIMDGMSRGRDPRRSRDERKRLWGYKMDCPSPSPSIIQSCQDRLYQGVYTCLKQVWAKSYGTSEYGFKA